MKQLKQLWTNLQASFWCVPSLIAAFSILLAVAFDRSGLQSRLASKLDWM